LVREALNCCPEDTSEVAELLVSELVTNAVVHAQSRLVLQVEVADPRVEVSVEDLGGGLPLPTPDAPEDDSVGGRGLLLVDALADSWGCEQTPSGKRVWFELAWR
jgi:anti-sigma regulatory factor (Ser/Thr protein kinase)